MTTSARIFVNEGSFGILDAGEVPIETADWSQNLLVPMAQGAMVLTGINTGNVTVEVAPADEPRNENWEEAVSTCLWAPAGNLRVESLIHGAHYGLPLLSADGPGWYQVEVKARGRHLERDGSNLESTESYLISVRPSPGPRTASDTTTHHLQETAAEADALRQRLIRGGGS
ncbi:hypothetical protein ACWGHA_34190 [Streptomyces xanthophaeus]